MAESIELVQDGISSRPHVAARVWSRTWGLASNAMYLRIGVELLLTAAVSAMFLHSISPHDRILQGVTVGGIVVGGLEPEAARAVLTDTAAPLLSDQIVLVMGDRSEPVSISDLGGRPDWDRALAIAQSAGREDSFWRRWQTRYVHACGRTADAKIPVRWNETKLRERLREISARNGVAPTPARLEFGEDGSFFIVPDKPGTGIDEETAVSTLRPLSIRTHAQEVAIPLTTQAARVTAEELGTINTKLAQFSTSLGSSSRNRVHNITRATAALNGVTLLPGEVFSFNKTVGPRLRSLGFREAPVYESGRVVPGTGGGTCQVSTTLYNLALMTQCQVVERSSHSMPVHYVPLGRDATVAYGNIDLRFKNTGRYPIYIFTRVANWRCFMAAYGHEADKIEVRLRSNVLSSRAVRKVIVRDSSLPAGKRAVDVKGNRGFTVSVTREVWKDNTRIERKVIHTDRYRKHDRIERVGVGAGAAG